MRRIEAPRRNLGQRLSPLPVLAVYVENLRDVRKRCTLEGSSAADPTQPPRECISDSGKPLAPNSNTLEPPVVRRDLQLLKCMDAELIVNALRGLETDANDASEEFHGVALAPQSLEHRQAARCS